MMKNYAFIFIMFVLLSQGCKNRSLSEDEEFKPREIHEQIDIHFDEIKVDGVDYLILEKDNNNPHEGFGFMAFRANKLLEKQDSILAYMQTMQAMQVKMYARLFGVSEDGASQISNELLQEYLNIRGSEIGALKNAEYSGRTNTELEKKEEEN